MTLGEVVASNLRRLRHENGLSQEELAHRAGIARNYISMIERCERSPTVNTIERLAAAFGIDAADLFRQARSRGRRGET